MKIFDAATTGATDKRQVKGKTTVLVSGAFGGTGTVTVGLAMDGVGPIVVHTFSAEGVFTVDAPDDSEITLTVVGGTAPSINAAMGEV